MPSYTTTWGDGVDPQQAQLHQGPARQAMVTQSTHDHRASTAHISYPEINFTDLQRDLSHVEISQHGALLTVMHVTANGLIGSHATASEAPAYHSQLSHLEAPQPQRPVSPLLLQDIPLVKVPDRGFQGTLRKLSPFSERSYLKSGLPRRTEYGDLNLLYVGKYEDPRSRDFRRDPEESSPPEEDDNTESPTSNSPLPPSPTDGEDAFSVCRRAHEASITNFHGWYPGKRTYAEAEVQLQPTESNARSEARFYAEESRSRYEARFDTEESRLRHEHEVLRVEAALRTLLH